jgi:hypothetical protein
MSLRPGDVVHVAPQNRAYRREPITVKLTRIREELIRYYDNKWVWLEGYRIEPDGKVGPWTQVLARIASLPAGTISKPPARS